MSQAITVNWQRVPSRFHYFREAVEACGEMRILKFDETLGRHVRFAEHVTKRQLAHLAPVYEKILAQGDLESLWDWLDEAERGSPSEKKVAWHVRGILIVFSDLAERGLLPFAREQISACRPKSCLASLGTGILAPWSQRLVKNTAVAEGRGDSRDRRDWFPRIPYDPPARRQLLRRSHGALLPWSSSKEAEQRRGIILVS